MELSTAEPNGVGRGCSSLKIFRGARVTAQGPRKRRADLALGQQPDHSKAFPTGSEARHTRRRQAVTSRALREAAEDPLRDQKSPAPDNAR